MNIPRLFQKLITLVVVVILVFGFAARSASAANLFNAPDGATIFINYYTGLEVGVTVFNRDKHIKRAVLWCNNYFENGGVKKWKSKCVENQELKPSKEYVIQGFSKSTDPNGDSCWNKTVMNFTEIYSADPIPEPSTIPRNRRYLITMFSKMNNPLAQITIDGLNLQHNGQGKPSVKQIPYPLCR